MITKIMQMAKKSLTGKYITTLLKLMPRETSIALTLMVFISLTEGISLLLLIPLLQIVGLDVQQGSLGQIANFISSSFSYIGIKPTLATILIIYVLVISLNAYFDKLKTIKSSSIEYEFAAHLRKRLFKSVTYSSWLFFIKNRSSDFAHALTYEIERITNGTSHFLYFVSSSIVIAVYVIFALELSGIITGLILFTGFILLLLLKKRTQLANINGEKLSETSKNMYSATIKQIDGMKTIKSFNLEEKNIEMFKNVTDDVSKKYIDTVKSYADVEFFFNVGSVVILSIIVFILIDVMSISTAELLLLLYLFVRVVPQFSVIQNSYQYFINMLPAFSTVITLENECIKSNEPKNEIKEMKLNKEISFKNVSFSYNKKNKSFGIKCLNFKIEGGKTTAIAGLSGAGKSTIADLVMGLIKPSNGYIFVDNTLLTPENASSWRNQIGYVAQDSFLFNDTVRNNLILADPKADDNEILEALRLASADKFVLKLPEGLDTLIGDRGVRLSGGERQRLALARALLHKPSILILDEATSNLDSENEKNILNSIERLHGNLTILIIAHRLSTIRNADKIYVIDEGNLVESGNWNSLIENINGSFRAFYEAQS